MRLPLPALLALLTTTTFAFYPYHRSDDEQTSQNSPRAVSRPRSTTSDNSLHVPIRRAPFKRANNFPVVRANTPTQQNSLGVNQDGTDQSYFVSFKVGTSNKEFQLLLDSAASNTWVMGAECTNNACGLHNTMGTKDSTTLKTQSGTFAVTYGTGSVSGSEASDTVHLGDMSVPLTFGLAKVVSDDFSFFPMDGILGLGRQENIADKTGMIDAPTLMDVLVSQKVITSKLYGLDLWRASDGGANTGALHFGKADTSRYTGDLNQIAAIKNNLGFWELPVKDAGVNGNIAGLGGRTAIIDSGTSYILMPRDDAVQLHELISGYRTDGVEGFTVPCDSKAKVQLTFGTVTYDILPADYISSRLVNGQCATNIIGRQTFGARQWLVGDVFLKNVYAVFDFEGQRVGFGAKKAGGGAGGQASPIGEFDDILVATDLEGTNEMSTSAPSSTTTFLEAITTSFSTTGANVPTIIPTSTSSTPAEIDVLPPAPVLPTIPTFTQEEQSTLQSPPSSVSSTPEISTKTSPPSIALTSLLSYDQFTTLTHISTSGTGSARPPSATATGVGTGAGTFLPPGANGASGTGTGSLSAEASRSTSSATAAPSGEAANGVEGMLARGLYGMIFPWLVLWMGFCI